MKPIRTLIVTALALFISLTAQAQAPFNPALVGGEKVILRTPNNDQTVTLSQPETPNACYEWSGPNIIGDRNKATITANPVSDVSTYYVTRTDLCGVAETEIKVRLTDTLYIVSVTPKVCYNDGDVISIEDFDIVTYPEGYESMVAFTPTIAENHGFAFVEKLQSITFYVIHNNQESSKTVDVTVINDNLTASSSISPDFEDLKNKIEKVKRMLEGVEDLESIFAVAQSTSPCNFGTSSSFDINMPQVTYYCCEGKKVDAFNLPSFSVSGSATFSCSVPIPYVSIPCVGGLMADFTMSASITVGPLNIRFRGECSQADIPVELSAEMGGGVSISLVSKDFLSGSLYLLGRGKTPIKWTIGKEVNWEGVELSVVIRGEVKALGLVSSKIEKPLYSWTLFKN